MKKALFWLTGIIGLALVFAPLKFGFLHSDAATLVSAGFGMVIFLAATYKNLVLDNGRWEYWLVGIAGIGIIIAPFALNYHQQIQQTALYLSLLMGSIILIIAAYQIASRSKDLM